MIQCPFDMVAVGKAIRHCLTEQGFPRCQFIVIVVDENQGKAIASNLLDPDSATRLLVEAAMIMDMADLQEEEHAGHA